MHARLMQNKAALGCLLHQNETKVQKPRMQQKHLPDVIPVDTRDQNLSFVIIDKQASNHGGTLVFTSHVA